MAEDRRVIQLLVDSAGVRLDKFISEQCHDISRTEAHRLVVDGRVTVNGSLARPALKLCAGDRVVMELPPPAPSKLSPETIPLKVVYEDDDVLVVDKPAGLPVHPAPGHPAHTLANAVLSLFPQVADAGDRQRPGIVHRLDKDTSGLIIVAKSNQAHRSLTSQFKNRKVTKGYLTLVHGIVEPREGVIEAPIGRDRSHRQRMAVVAESHGREARTHYRVIRYIAEYTLLEVRPETGRTHQIRVHLAAIGHPVVGDGVYGRKTDRLKRQFLHASLVGFTSPSSGQYIQLASDLPPDLEQVLEVVGHTGGRAHGGPSTGRQRIGFGPRSDP